MKKKTLFREIIARRKERQIAISLFRQTDEMRVAVETLEAGSTEKSINDMAGRHFEEQSLLQGYWGSRIDALKLDQRRQYRNWIMRLLEEQQTSMIPTPV